MHIQFIVRLLIALVTLGMTSPLFAAVQLTPVVSGLASPIFVGHAGDGSNRLFIVEQAGKIRVLQPGSSTPTDFLNITAKVLSGGERGLLGLAFHPQYPTTGRFFVFYTRAGDGAIVVAEYAVSTSNPNVANTTEKVLMTIPHPSFSNHNGGMLAFDHEGFLHIGVGDGGSSRDPANNAQSVSTLLGKILRIDVNPPDGSGVPYLSPPTNPFADVGDPGRDEIFAYGMRNPWRFSFDRTTWQEWVADVGQGAREEVDTPIVNGGNYGWRVYEGFECTGTDAALCNPANYIFPMFDYSHVNGRCSITGGYVYRGSQNVLPSGTYVYGDYCTGEIFTWNGSAQALLTDTTFNISSFGEDEAGELYVVNLGGSISRLDSTEPCAYSINPTSQNVGSTGGAGFTVGVTAGTGCGWTAAANVSWLHVTGGGSGTANGTVTYSVDANGSTSGRQGTMTVAGRTFTVNQNGAPSSCSFSISPRSATVGRQGGTGTVAVTATAGCNWTAVSAVPWITITGGASGTGNGTVTYSVAASSGKPRNGSMTIAGRSFSVKQR